MKRYDKISVYERLFWKFCVRKIGGGENREEIGWMKKRIDGESWGLEKGYIDIYLI